MESSLLWTALIVFAQLLSYRFVNLEGVLSHSSLAQLFLRGVVLELLQL